jgi:hypothetical protein
LVESCALPVSQLILISQHDRAFEHVWECGIDRHLVGGSPRAFRAWPLAWPLPSGPLGWQRSPGSTARRRRVPRSGMRSTVEAGGASPDNARRSGPMSVTTPATGALGATLTAWPWCWRARQRDTAGTAGGRSPGPPCAAARRAVGLASEGRGESCRPRDGETSGEPRPPTAGHPGRSSPLDCSRPSSLFTAWPSGPARRRCALETVEKVVTAPLTEGEGEGAPLVPIPTDR